MLAQLERNTPQTANPNGLPMSNVGHGSGKYQAAQKCFLIETRVFEQSFLLQEHHANPWFQSGIALDTL